MEMYQKNFDEEKEFLSEVFYSDTKNYHMWGYRLWFIERFNLYDDEMQFIEEELELEVTNNSLWSYRYFINMKTKEFNLEFV